MNREKKTLHTRKSSTRRNFARSSLKAHLLLEELESRLLLTTFNNFTADPLYLNLNYAIYRPSASTLYIDTTQDRNADKFIAYGQAGDKPVVGDVNGDSITDIGVLRNGAWIMDTNRDGAADTTYNFGLQSDTPLIGDLDTDGFGDLIAFRNGTWFISTTRNGTVASSTVFGQTGDIPLVGDFNADGRLDRAIYRPSNFTWYVDTSFSGTPTSFVVFGGTANDIPFVADFNDDKFSDFGIFRNGVVFGSTSRNGTANVTFNYGTTGDIPIFGSYSTAAVSHALRTGIGTYNPTTNLLSLDPAQSGTATQNRVFGAAGDLLVNADFDGNTVTDQAAFRNGVWFIDTNHDGVSDSTVIFGQAGDKPAAADVNNDGVADLIIFRNGTWFVDTNRNGTPDSTTIFGQSGDIPLAGDFNGDGAMDRAIFRSGTWYVDYSFNGSADAFYNFGVSTDTPFAFDFNYDGKADIGVYRAGTWFVDTAHNGSAGVKFNFGAANLLPAVGNFETANSIFVKPGGSGNGTEASPYGSLAAAIAASTSGTFIRLAPGTFNQSAAVTNKSNLTFVANNRNATLINPVALASGNAFSVTTSSNIYIQNVTARSADTDTRFGRGIVPVSSSVFARGIIASGNRQENIYAASTTVDSLFYLRDGNLDSSITSCGIFNQGESTIRLTNVTSNTNGTSNTTKTTQWGRGYAMTGTGTATTLNGFTSSNNPGHGLDVEGTGIMLLRASTFNNNPNTNGAIIAQNITFTIDGCTFNNNGTIGDPNKKFNGFEADLFTGFNGYILNSTFSNNSAFGIFLGGGPYYLVQGNTFSNNVEAQLLVNGVDFRPNGEVNVTGSTTAYVYGNSFSITSGTNSVGLTGAGSGAVAYIGGASTALKNTFTNFPEFNSIFVDRDPNNLSSIANFYCLPQSSNIFVNSTANPIGGYGAKTLP